ncbi:restriction endonuclease subunit S [Vibrio chagasii]|uniref:restriction endonuclease subunit S n=1 Tax=Vibrio chagasii TaxID=170679 RepID=UPI002284C2E9|nr:restriction endonuclease subunit S [Vibrio chagasii]MCY9826364.1 restriction endonuclease subunit S [Vibrio chagasii]
MSDLGCMKQLLSDVDVEWMALGDIGEFIRGNGMQKKDFSNEGFPAIHYGQIFTRYDLSADKTFTYVPEQLAKKLKKAHKNDLLLATTSENDKDVVKPLAWLGEEAAISGDMMLFRHAQNVKYLAYCFQTSAFQTQKQKYISGAKVRRVSKDSLAKMYVPIPCPKDHKRSLEIQAEIVRILDTLREISQKLTQELTQELVARKNQYNYYRDVLLSFDQDGVDIKSLGELAKIQRGASPRPIVRYIANDENGVPWIKIGDTTPSSKLVTKTAQRITLEGSKKSRLLKKGDFIMSNSMSYGRPYILAIDGAIHDGWASISEFGKHLNSDFLYHYLSSNKVKNYWESKINSSSVSNLNSDIIRSLPIPMIPLDKQVSIAKTLDEFDALSCGIIADLPKEIELRQKQYEYYRDLLLSFPKPREAEV